MIIEYNASRKFPLEAIVMAECNGKELIHSWKVSDLSDIKNLLDEILRHWDDKREMLVINTKVRNENMAITTMVKDIPKLNAYTSWLMDKLEEQI